MKVSDALEKVIESLEKHGVHNSELTISNTVEEGFEKSFILYKDVFHMLIKGVPNSKELHLTLSVHGEYSEEKGDYTPEELDQIIKSVFEIEKV